MVIKIIAGIDLSFLIFKMRIQAFVLRTSAREMFGHAGHTLRAESFVLKSFDVAFGETCGQMGILAEWAADARPARFVRKIDLRVQRNANSHCQVFPSNDISKHSHEFNVSNRPKPQGFAPL